MSEIATFGSSQPKSLACLQPLGAHNLRRHSKKEPIHQGWVCAPHTPPGSIIAHLKLVATLLETIVQAAPRKYRNPDQKKMHFRHFSPHFFAICVSDICAGVDKVTMKDVFQATKKLTSMVLSTDCRFLEHDGPTQPLLTTRPDWVWQVTRPEGGGGCKGPPPLSPEPIVG